jgi:serine/threonine protein kinase
MALTSGQVLQDRYRIASLLGQGGMGAVYRAWDRRLNVPVALKEMTSQPDLDPQTLAQLRQQFQQEAQILARLNHPHLVRVGDFFEGRDNAYLVMDFVEGESLAEIIKREGALAEPRVVAWAGQLLKALAYCHSQGIIHRDVKPQNVIIQPDGQAVLVDFGLVKLWNPRRGDGTHRCAERRLQPGCDAIPRAHGPGSADGDLAHSGPSTVRDAAGDDAQDKSHYRESGAEGAGVGSFPALAERGGDGRGARDYRPPGSGTTPRPCCSGCARP